MKKKKKPVKKGRPSGVITKLKAESKAVLELCNGDKELALFMTIYMQNGRNASKAYLSMKPNVKPESAKVLASRMLTRINIKDVAAVYGLDNDKYFTVLKQGLNAKTSTLVGSKDNRRIEYSKDWQTIDKMHTKLGKILGVEKENDTNINLNFGIMFGGGRKERGLDEPE